MKIKSGPFRGNVLLAILHTSKDGYVIEMNMRKKDAAEGYKQMQVLVEKDLETAKELYLRYIKKFSNEL